MKHDWALHLTSDLRWPARGTASYWTRLQVSCDVGRREARPMGGGARATVAAQCRGSLRAGDCGAGSIANVGPQCAEASAPAGRARDGLRSGCAGRRAGPPVPPGTLALWRRPAVAQIPERPLTARGNYRLRKLRKRSG